MLYPSGRHGWPGNKGLHFQNLKNGIHLPLSAGETGACGNVEIIYFKAVNKKRDMNRCSAFCLQQFRTLKSFTLIPDTGRVITTLFCIY